MRVLAMQQPLAAQQILGKIFKCLNLQFFKFSTCPRFGMGEKIGFICEIEFISEFETRISKKYELFIGNLSEALPVLGAGMNA
jgi:hypothetical protein